MVNEATAVAGAVRSATFGRVTYLIAVSFSRTIICITSPEAFWLEYMSALRVSVFPRSPSGPTRPTCRYAHFHAPVVDADMDTPRALPSTFTFTLFCVVHAAVSLKFARFAGAIITCPAPDTPRSSPPASAPSSILSHTSSDIAQSFISPKASARQA